jgi:class 3 adenylate cyclase
MHPAMLLRRLSIKRALIAISLASTALMLGWAAYSWRLFLTPLPEPRGGSAFLPLVILLGEPAGWIHPITWLCVAAAVAAPALLALALLRGDPSNVAANHLCAGLSAIAAVLSHWCFVMPLQLLPPGPTAAAVSIASGFLIAWGLQQLTAFVCLFPSRVDLAAMGQWMRAEREIKEGVLPSWFTGLRKKAAGANLGWEKWYEEQEALVLVYLGSRRGLVLFGTFFAGGVLLAEFSVFAGDSRWHGAMFILILVVLGFGWLTTPLAWTFRTGSDGERKKVYWIYWGVSLSLWIVLVLLWTSAAGAIFVSAKFVPIAIVGCTVALPSFIISTTAAVAFAVFFQGALDPRLAISRTSVVGLFSMALPPVILAGENFIQNGLLARFDLPRHLTTWIFLGLAAITYRSVSKRLEDWLGTKLDEWLPASALAGAERASAVIGFVDLSGYTALSAQDEKAALTHAAALHKAGRTAMASGGRLVKTLGDAVLWESSSAAKAVAVARALQAAYTAECAAEKLIPLPLHFGLHAGEIVRSKDGDVFGSTVNIASRLLGQAGSGEIVASAAVVEGLAGTSFSVQPLGAKALKNVPEPVFCFRIASA